MIRVQQLACGNGCLDGKLSEGWQPLNATLYYRLRDLFGEVKITHPGSNIVYHYETTVDGRKVLRADFYGETYCVNCPHCGDRRRRLWICHKWGTFDHTSRSLLLYLLICYNENCFADRARRKELWQKVYNEFLCDDPDYLEEVEELKFVAPQIEYTIEATLPDGFVRLTDVPPIHPCRQYLRQRGFNDELLSKLLGLGYVSCNSSSPARGRLLIPVYMEGQLRGWQARSMDDQTKPKYLTMPGMRKSQILYNFDFAKRYNYVVVMEGAFDVWRYGPEAVAIFGHHISDYQQKLLLSTWPHIIICFDSDAIDEAYAMAHRLRLYNLGNVQVHVARLDPGKDPADYDTPSLRQLVMASIRSESAHIIGANRGRNIDVVNI
jgi:hypothetical protein